MASNNIVVLGAGVIGLTTAMLLSQDANNKVMVAAKHMPGDYDIEYTSPWAGANYLPYAAYFYDDKILVNVIHRVGQENSKIGQWEKATWPHLQELARNCPEAGIHFQDTVCYNRKKDQESTIGKWFSELIKPNPWYNKVVPNYREIPANELKEGIDNANSFTSVCINTALYLPWLVGQCRKNGVIFKRAIVGHISEAANLHHSGTKADVVVNCTGLSSRNLGGVMDTTVSPARGQIVLVRNDPELMFTISGTDDGDDEATYIMTRAAGGGTILGGSYQKNNWDPNPDPNLAIRIMKRCIELCPSLVGEGQGIEGLSVIRHGVGLRPLRENGPRIDREKFEDFWVVHNYGHAGYGYQTSYGSATEAVGLVKQALQHSKQAKL